MKDAALMLFMLLIVFNNFGQIKLKVGDTAPNISITDYIKNTPEEKNIKNKYVLLEFWTTWCATCLQEVPKLNQLQERFKSNKNLVFISITDEKPDKVLRTLKRISFSSIVVSDQKRETHKSFFENNGESIVYPSTILIDKKGIIKWIGTPDLINESILKKLVTGKEIKITDNNTDNLFPDSPHPSSGKSLTDVVYKTQTNDTLQYSFVLLKNETKGPNAYMNILERDGMYIDTNSNLSTIISKLTSLNEESISIPENLKKDKYSILYNNKELKSVADGVEDIKNNLLRALNLKEKTVLRNVDTYVLRLVDKNKLEEIKNEKEMKDGGNMTHLLLANIKMENLTNSIKNHFKMFVIDETNLLGNYDFILRNDSKENLIEDLAIYGLTLVKEKRDIPFYEYH